MAYRLVTIAGEGEPWGAAVLRALERLEAEGWVLCAMTTRTVAVPHTVALGTPTRYEEQLVLVLYKS